MGLPRKDFTGQTATITVSEFRATPGDVLDRAEHGMVVTITKRGKVVARLFPAPTIIASDGSYSGERPLTKGQRL